MWAAYARNARTSLLCVTPPHRIWPCACVIRSRKIDPLQAAARASQPLTLTVVLDTLYQGTLALDKWVWQELVSEVRGFEV